MSNRVYTRYLGRVSVQYCWKLCDILYQETKLTVTMRRINQTVVELQVSGFGAGIYARFQRAEDIRRGFIEGYKHRTLMKWK